MNKIMSLLKKIIISAFILYGYNFIASNFNLIIPINIYSLGFVSIFGSVALVALVLFRILVL